MNRSINARIRGDDYQRLFFWFWALKMFFPTTCIEKVEYESGYVKSFDDIIVHYKEDKPYVDCRNNPIDADFFQIKFHVTDNGTITWDRLMDPSFINAEKVSLMERLRDAHKKCVENGIEGRFNFVCSWQIHPDDKLKEIVSNDEYEIRIDKLFDGKQRSDMAKMRQKMTEHLDLSNEDELEEILMNFTIWHGSKSIQFIVHSLNYYLAASGFKPIENDSILNQYTELVKEWSLREITEFDKNFIIEACKRENLYLGSNSVSLDYIDVGIRSFYIGAENMQDETTELCSVLDFFEDRYIKDNSYWNKEIFDELNKFRGKLSSNNKYRLHMDTHLSIAFVIGSLLHSTIGIEIYPIQKTMGVKEFWYPEEDSGKDYDDWEVDEKVLSKDIKDVALVLGVNNDILNEVEEYIAEEEIDISKIINCNVGGQVRPDVIIDGRHAYELAISLSTLLKEKRNTQEKRNRLHIFAACPVGFMFYLGKVSRFFGKVSLYEYDRYGISGRHYLPSFELPIKR